MKSIQEYFKTAAPSPIELLNAKRAVNPAANVATQAVLPPANRHLFLSSFDSYFFSLNRGKMNTLRLQLDISKKDDVYNFLRNNQQLESLHWNGPIECGFDKVLDYLPDSLLGLRVLGQPVHYPFNFTKFKNITSVTLSFMSLSEVPASLMTLSTLQYLNLSNNKIEGDIPEFICNLTNLEDLNLAGNRLTGIPECMADMRSLKQIDLAYNDIDGASLLNFLNNMSDEMLHNLETLFIRYDDRGERGRRIRSYSSDEEVRYDDAADTGRRINSNVSDAEVEMFQEAILERLAKYYNDVATDTLLLVIDILPPQFRNLNRKEIMDAYRAYEQGPGGLMGGKSRSRKSKKRCKRRKRRTKKL